MPAPLEDHCECTHVKDKHQIAVQAGKIWSGPCRSCECLKFVKSSIEEEPLTAADYATHFPVELLEVAVQSPETGISGETNKAQESVSEQVSARLEADTPTVTLLDFYDAWRCPACSSRWFNKRRCCGTGPQPIRVEIHAREP